MVTPRSIDRGGAVTGDAGEDQASATLLDGWDQSAVTTYPVTHNGGNPTFGGSVVSFTKEDIAVDTFNKPTDLGGPTVLPSVQALLQELPTSLSARTMHFIYSYTISKDIYPRLWWWKIVILS